MSRAFTKENAGEPVRRYRLPRRDDPGFDEAAAWALLETHPLPRLTAALSGRYAIERELGRGGVATDYLARDLKHDRSTPCSMS